MIEIVVTICGAALIVTAAAARQPWLDRHFLPSFFISRHTYVIIETIVRVALAAAGVSLVLGRARIARLLTRSPGMAVSIVAAAALATGASDLALRTSHPRPAGWLVPEEE